MVNLLPVADRFQTRGSRSGSSIYPLWDNRRPHAHSDGRRLTHICLCVQINITCCNTKFLISLAIERPFVKRFDLCYWTVVCLSVCLSVCPVMSVTLVYCGQTVRSIKMKLGMEVGLGSGDFVLDGEPALHPKGAQPPVFGPCLLWPNGWMDLDATWYGGMPRPRQLCVRRGPSSLPKRAQPPIFGPCLLWPNGWMDQDSTWYGGRPRPWRYCVRWGSSSPSQKGHITHFRPMSIVAKR